MEFKVFPSQKNTYPIKGVALKGNDPYQWLLKIQQLNLRLSEVQIFPLPGATPNTIWGCLIALNTSNTPLEMEEVQLFQCFENKLFIPEYADFSPKIKANDLTRMLQTPYCCYHPEIGFVELEETYTLEDFLVLPEEKSCYTFTPEIGTVIPSTIKRMSIIALDEEETLKQLEEKFPKNEPLPQKPLSFLDKIRLWGYRTFLGNKAKSKTSVPMAESNVPVSVKQSIWQKLFSKKPKMMDAILDDYKNLEERNKNEVDKLLDMLKNNPDMALKYAIPINSEGLPRGVQKGSYTFRQYRNSLGLSGGNTNRSGVTIDIGDESLRLTTQYQNTAKQLIQSGDYEKAAFVYLKLLQDYSLAGSTLEEGGQYAAAASIYLKYAKDKMRAAKCYEKGNLTNKAIELYIELGENIKVGDLYYYENKIEEGNNYYLKEVEELKKNNKYIKAADVFEHKMGQLENAQATLFEGWTEKKDSINCLHNYFSNIKDDKVYKKKVESIYDSLDNVEVKTVYLKVIRKQFEKQKQHNQQLKTMAYKIISEVGKTNPKVVTELNAFNKNNVEVSKDITRFKLNT